MLKPLLLPSAAALLVIASMSAPANPPQAASGNSAKTASTNSQAMAKAKQVYNIDCALCHGESGDGKTDVAKGMELNLLDWTDSKTLADRQDQDLFNIIRNGKGKMPSEGTGRATDAEVKSMITYIRGFGKESASAPTAPAAGSAPATAPAPAASTPPSPNQ